MRFTKLPLEGLYLIEPTVYQDERGFFYESYRHDVFTRETGLTIHWVQDNHSFSCYGVLRGLHFQRHPFAQSKLVRVVEGKVWDVAVDLRATSPTFGKYYGVELSAENKLQFFIPAGFAHGFVTLSPQAQFLYKCDAYYNKEHESGLLWNDPALAIPWPIDAKDVIVSPKDASLAQLKDIGTPFP